LRRVEKMITFKGRQKRYNVGPKTGQMGKPHIPTMVEKLITSKGRHKIQWGSQKLVKWGKRVSCHEINRTLRCIHT
jgi:hypothetical protein